MQNEYIFAAPQNADGTLDEPICTAPDLISILDMSGSALGCHELRFGLLVNVIGMLSSDVVAKNLLMTLSKLLETGRIIVHSSPI